MKSNHFGYLRYLSHSSHFVALAPWDLWDKCDRWDLYTARNQRFSNRFVRRADFLYQFNIQAQRLQLAHEHVEAFRQTRIEISFTLDDRFIYFRSSGNVVGLRR